MIAKSVEKERALQMRNQGYSLREISEKLKVSKASVSLWSKGLSLSQKAKRRIWKLRQEAQIKSQEVNRARTRTRLAEARQFAQTSVAAIKVDINLARLICSMLYWCEGAKDANDKTLSFTNSDPSLTFTFLCFLRKGFSVDEKKFSVCVHLHDYHDKEKQLQFWSRITRIPRVQFMEPYRKPHTGKRIRKDYAGCASVRYHDVRIARQVIATARAFLKKQGP